jgi:hypothetical protein
MALLSVSKRFLPALFFLLPGILNNSISYSQTINSSGKQNETLFLVRTKQFNEFLNRFNYKINFNGDKVDSAFMTKIPRDKMISSLFDLKDPRIDPLNKSYSASYISAKSEFINEVVSKKLLIYKYSDKIIAEAKSHILFKGIPNTISIFLSQEIVGKDMVKWVINTVKGSIFNFLKSDTTFVRFIPPSSNETDFMNLKRALEDTDYLQYYASKDYTPDNLALFFFLVNSGSVKFEYTEGITYHILDIPGWSISVKDFNRNEMNSGWLITDVSRNSSDKDCYLKTLK